MQEVGPKRWRQSNRFTKVAGIKSRSDGDKNHNVHKCCGPLLTYLFLTVVSTGSFQRRRL